MNRIRGASRTVRVFLVDDDEVDRLIVERLLDGVEGIELRVFDSGEVVLKAVASEGCDCLLLDYRMPELDGLEVLDRIRAAELEVPTIMLTGAGDEEIAVSSMHRGALDYISKHRVDRGILLTKIEAVRRVHEAHERTLAVEHDLRETVARLRREIHARESLLGVVSHDLRGPLNNIGLAMKLLEIDSPEARARALASMTRALARAERLINDLLDVARISDTEFEVTQSSVSVHTLVETAVLEVRPMAEAKGVVVRTELPDGAASVHADKDRVIQVFDNLLRNALEHGPEAGTIVVAAEPRGDHVEFSVQDEGPGLTPEERELVFDRFWQAKTRGRAKGSGLGLAIAKGIVAAHGGEIRVEAAEGGGARFVFTIPKEP